MLLDIPDNNYQYIYNTLEKHNISSEVENNKNTILFSFHKDDNISPRDEYTLDLNYSHLFKKINNKIIVELDELLLDIKEWQDDGINLSKESIYHAKNFAKNIIIKNNLPIPDIEIHPDGQVAFTWQKKGMGIANFAFDKIGLVTWASYFEKSHRKLKGSFSISESVSDIELDIINKFSIKNS